MNDSKIIVALDYPTQAPAMEMVNLLDPTLCKLKVGKQLFCSAGPQFVERLASRGWDVFLDLKFHDIPNTVAGAIRSCRSMGVWMLNVHAAGGYEMMAAAMETIRDGKYPRPFVVAVTVLTSLDENDLWNLGIDSNIQEQVLRLALLAKQAGIDGVVCSAQEASLLKDGVKEPFLAVTPGIRLEATSDDQKRTMTPTQAVAEGSDFLVIGRPITQSNTPMKVVHDITRQLLGDAEHESTTTESAT